MRGCVHQSPTLITSTSTSALRKNLPQTIQLIELGYGADANAVPGIVVHGYLLYIGLDALQRKLGAHPIRVGKVLVRAGLQNVGAAARLGQRV